MKYGKALLVLIMLLSLSACAQSINTSEESVDNSDIQSETGSVAEAVTSSDTEKMTGIMYFGTYPQDTEAPEPIEWIVLDRQNDKTLLLAKNCIDSLPWHNAHEQVAWDNSDIRAWLNGEFLQTAFTEVEQENILLSDLDNGDDLKYGTPVGTDTQDKVFLLSGAEAENYFPSDDSRTAKSTRYAITHGAYTNDRGDCAWWLRSPGMTGTSPAYIASAGNFGNRAHEVDESIIGIRPAIWMITD